MAEASILDWSTIVNVRDAEIEMSPPPAEPLASVEEAEAIFTSSPSITMRPPTLTNFVVSLLASNEPL